ncbi:hypothetical protein CAPTEDRAFT_131587 [Capitella teleta]|uniref:Major facilitator superfamily (MFS) profile domain-containing protein n=1 Tax=Capitella teleta TaxID=283909 RepID=R7UCY8_CAPTE|nr:hypothetical protein CAPTEDRAFT_131587 [Capitella teleta]|eukprot:ELU03854.1 hypothetical protein CAPTEDRAFT_131587 [Capitella teleta]
MLTLRSFLPNLNLRGPSECLKACRASRRLVLFIVFIALFLDNMLLTTVVPIIPNFLYQMHHQNDDNLTIGFGMVNRSTPVVYKTTCYRKGDTQTHIYEHYARNYGGYEVRYPCANTSDGYGEAPFEEFNDTTSKNDTLYETTLMKKQRRHEDILDENVAVGLMFASKAIMQLITNPFIGPLTNRIGYSIPLFAGFVIMFTSTITFAFATNYTVLFVARTIQGIGSACSSVSGMGMLAERYPDDRERGNAMGIALGGLALGVLVGPPFGGVMYQFVGKEAPFLILALLALFDGCLQLFMLQPSVSPEAQQGSSIFELLKDPYILIVAGSITFANMGIAMLEPSLPLWMLDTMDAEKWQQGAAFLPASISYLIGTNLFGPLAHRIGRWLSAMVGMAIIGVCLFVIPFATNIGHLIAPNFGLGFSIGMVDSSMMPIMGYLVDLRHVPVYGSVYAIADVAFCVGFAIGPALSGTIIKAVGFKWMLWMMAIVNILYCPLLVFLRNPPGKEEKQSLMMNDKTPVQYVTYNKHSTGYQQFENTDEEAAEADY